MGQIDLYLTIAVVAISVAYLSGTVQGPDPDVDRTMVPHVAGKAGRHRVAGVLKFLYCSDLTFEEHVLVDKGMTHPVVIQNERPDLDVALVRERILANILAVARSWA